MRDTSLPDYIQTVDPSLVRDTNSKALLNTNVNALARHRRNITKANAAVNTLAELRARQLYLETCLSDMNDKLTALLEHTR